MRIAIHAADLDHDRIDGTRVYMLSMLRNFGVLDSQDAFYVYHKNEFNPLLEPPKFSNYSIKKKPFPFMWTQTRFAFELLRNKPDVLWMPVQNIPLLRNSRMKTVVTIHDLAFKIFPQYFPTRDLAKLNRLTDNAVSRADRIIAISESTKHDLLRFYPNLEEKKIFVVHHGFDRDLFEKDISADFSQMILEKYGIEKNKYLLYIGAIQPRKDLVTLVEAFEKIKEKNPGLKLVIAGAPAWNYEDTLKKITSSIYSGDVVVTGKTVFEEQPVLYRQAAAFVLPSLYEGFGIPVLEAMASSVPVICARNSSLVEVGAEAVRFFETSNAEDLTEKLNEVLGSKELREEMIRRGKERIKEFSWEKCAQETLEVIKGLD
ncbi:MAG TPA: glycosyltransferase family 1 protein [Patescibacteria group bacterium]